MPSSYYLPDGTKITPWQAEEELKAGRAIDIGTPVWTGQGVFILCLFTLFVGLVVGFMLGAVFT